MTLDLIQHIDSPVIALFAVCVAVGSIAVLPWSEGELRQSVAAGRAAAELVVDWVRGVAMPPLVPVPAVPRRRIVRFSRTLQTA